MQLVEHFAHWLLAENADPGKTFTAGKKSYQEFLHFKMMRSTCGKKHPSNSNDRNVTFSGRPNDVKPDFEPPTPPSVSSWKSLDNSQFIWFIEPCSFSQADAKKSQVLHLSDFHMDLTYQIGTDVDCGMPMCCMNSTPMATDPAKAAGDWGSYKCDLTRWTAEDMLQHIAEEHKDEVLSVCLFKVIFSCALNEHEQCTMYNIG